MREHGGSSRGADRRADADSMAGAARTLIQLGQDFSNSTRVKILDELGQVTVLVERRRIRR